MTRRGTGWIAAALLVTVVATAAWWWPRGSTQDLPSGALRGYNVLLISIDTLRADRLGAYGSRAGLTPALDRLATEGLRFETAYSHVPLTLPSHASLLTGRLPPRHGVRDNGSYRLAEDQPTLATRLADAGYRAAAFVGAFVLDARFGLARGFEMYDDYYGERSTPGRVEVVERSAERVTAPAVKWISSVSGPWFAWVHVYDPHEPYTPPEPYASRYTGAPYDGEVAYIDATLGRMLWELRAAGRLDRTLVVVTADHGESLGEHGERSHGLFAYNSTLRVPLIVWSADRIRPGIVSRPARLVDVVPTILDLLGTSAADIDGRSLRPLVTGETQDDAPTYFEALNANLTRNWAPLTGVVAGSLKLIDLPIPEVYDIRADPAETRNLYAGRQDDARRLEAILDRMGGATTAAAGQVDAATRARLASLGYVVGSSAAPKKKYSAEDDPKNLVDVDAALEGAVVVAGRGDPERAIAMLREAIGRRPDMIVAYDRLAFLLRAQGRPAEAVAVLDDAASKGATDAALLVSLGTALRETGALERSASVLEAAIGLNPQDLDARSGLAMTYTRMGRPADAERLFREVLAADPHSATALTNLGVLYLSTERYNAAIDTLRRAIEADPGLAGPRNSLAVAYGKRGDLPRAVAEWQQALAAEPNRPDILYNLGTALLQLERRDEAVQILERFMAVAPGGPYATDIPRVRQMIERARRSDHAKVKGQRSKVKS